MDNILDINIKNYILIIRSAFAKVVGDKYLDIINERLDRSMYIPYTNFRGIKNYREYLLNCKRDNLMLDFFSSIGMDISKFQGIHYDSDYYEEFENLITIFLGAKNGMDFNVHKFGIMAFTPDEEFDTDIRKVTQICFLNDYLFQGQEVVTQKNYDEFKRSNVYKRIIDNINKWLPIIEDKKKEYQEFKKTLNPLLEYVTERQSTLKFIQESNRDAVYQFIKENCDEEWLKLYQETHKDNESASSILGDIDEYFGFAIFRGKYDNILAEKGKEFEKRNIMEKRLKFFEDIGYLDAPVSSFAGAIEGVYNVIMSSKEARRLIPSVSLRKKLEKLKEELIKKSEKELIKEDYYFIKRMQEERFSEETADALAEALVTSPVVVSNATCNDEKYILLYYTIREYDGGTLDYILLHEFIHLFEHFLRCIGEISGFDHLSSNDNRKNPYNRDNFRLYERFNETLTDMLAIDVLHVLHDEFKVFLLEDNSFIRSPINKNTNSILKNMLYPFYHDYFDIMIEAFMEEDLNILFDEVGRENFEELVDIVNYVDTLISKFGLADDIKTERTSSPFYGFYLNKVEETIDIYERMKRHKEEKKKTLSN